MTLDANRSRVENLSHLKKTISRKGPIVHLVAIKHGSMPKFKVLLKKTKTK